MFVGDPVVSGCRVTPSSVRHSLSGEVVDVFPLTRFDQSSGVVCSVETVDDTLRETLVDDTRLRTRL